MLFRFDESSPLHLQLFRALRDEILKGGLAPGTRLPSSRALAAEAGVSRNTVLVAYDQLLGEGYALGKRGSGTYVPHELPRPKSNLVGVEIRRRPAASSPVPRLSRLGQTIRDWEPTWAGRETRLPYDFRYGCPAPDLPHEPWRRLLARRMRKASVRDLDYGPPGGLPILREALAEYLRRARGVACDAEQVIIVHGSQQALDLTARVLLDPGDGVVVEEAHYPGARAAFLAAGARLVTAPVDAEGMDIGAPGVPLSQARLAYVTPSHQFPTGAVMSVARRLALLRWAERTGAYVLEDDYDSEFRYSGRPIQALQGLDGGGRVIYTGTFSKILFPGLRLGYLVPPPELRGPLVAAKALADTGCSAVLQLALADFIREGHFGRHIRRTRARNSARRVALLEAVRAHLGDEVEVSGANAGLHVLMWLRRLRSRDLQGFIRNAAAAGVGVYPVTACYLKPPARAGLLLGYSALTEKEIREGIRRLGRVLERTKT